MRKQAAVGSRPVRCTPALASTSLLRSPAPASTEEQETQHDSQELRTSVCKLAASGGSLVRCTATTEQQELRNPQPCISCQLLEVGL
jgi:hypothetical protein